MFSVFTVMLGGAIGAGGRYMLGSAIAGQLGDAFPWGTLVVNLIGGLAMGLLAGGLLRSSGNEGLRLLLGVGVLGGFTTFSAFGLDVVRLIEGGQAGPATIYVLASLIGSIGLTAAGMAAVRAL